MDILKHAWRGDTDEVKVNAVCRNGNLVGVGHEWSNLETFLC